jgi:shikimate 5-dehydrogenase
MFLRQAAEQYQLWIGDDSTVPLDIMRQAAEKALQRGGSHEIIAGGIAEE